MSGTNGTKTGQNGTHRRDSPPWRAPSPESDRRFEAWLAGASAEQIERWKRNHAAEAVPGDELPPPLRGGALEAF